MTYRPEAPYTPTTKNGDTAGSSIGYADALRTKARVAAGRNEQPSAAIIDSQTAKSVGAVHETGYNAGRITKGRKRHILVDTLGLILVAVVHAADIQDRDGGSLVINDTLYERFASLQVMYSDQGYNG